MSLLSNTAIWIQAMRLRTLPLASAGIITGMAFAARRIELDVNLGVWTLLTAISLQILSNLANDLGDFLKGTDNDNRKGPERALQSGKIGKKSMIRAVALFAVLSLGSGIHLLNLAFGSWLGQPVSWVFFGLGIFGIAAAVKYTVGKKAFGYSGLGDLFVFVFFGPVAVAGSFFLQIKVWDGHILFPAIALGLFSVSVLNLNNMRDIDNDRACGKRTLVVRMGLENAKTYHAFVLLLGWGLVTADWLMNFRAPLDLLVFLPAWIFFKNIKLVLGLCTSEELDGELKKVALGTLALSLLFLSLALGGS